VRRKATSLLPLIAGDSFPRFSQKAWHEWSILSNITTGNENVTDKIFPFFKKKKKEVTATEMGGALSRLVTPSESSDQTTLRFLQDTDDTIKQKVSNEMLFLQIFAIDTAVTSALGETTERDGVLNTFYDHVKKLISSIGESPWKDLKMRVLAYEEAFNTPHHGGAAFQVGKAFAKFCGYDISAVVMMAGSAEFTATVASASGLVKSFRIRV